MSLRVLNVLVVVAALGGCTTTEMGGAQGDVAAPSSIKSGCGAETPGPDGLRVCVVNVTVADGRPVPDLLDLDVGDPPFSNHEKVVWIIRTPGYSFKDVNAISFKSGGHGTIDTPAKESDQRYSVRVTTFQGVCKSYTITIYDSAGNAKSLDPTISNGYGFNRHKPGEPCMS